MGKEPEPSQDRQSLFDELRAKHLSKLSPRSRSIHRSDKRHRVGIECDGMMMRCGQRVTACGFPSGQGVRCWRLHDFAAVHRFLITQIDLPDLEQNLDAFEKLSAAVCRYPPIVPAE